MKIDKRTNTGKDLLKDIDFHTRMSKSYIRDLRRRLAKMTLDDQQDSRIKSSECIGCYYTDRLVTQAFTEYECGICHEKKMWHNGGTPKFCPECGKDNEICIQCGSNLYRNHEI